MLLLYHMVTLLEWLQSLHHLVPYAPTLQANASSLYFYSSNLPSLRWQGPLIPSLSSLWDESSLQAEGPHCWSITMTTLCRWTKWVGQYYSRVDTLLESVAEEEIWLKFRILTQWSIVSSAILGEVTVGRKQWLLASGPTCYQDGETAPGGPPDFRGRLFISWVYDHGMT